MFYQRLRDCRLLLDFGISAIELGVLRERHIGQSFHRQLYHASD